MSKKPHHKYRAGQKCYVIYDSQLVEAIVLSKFGFTWLFNQPRYWVCILEGRWKGEELAYTENNLRTEYFRRFKK